MENLGKDMLQFKWESMEWFKQLNKNQKEMIRLQHQALKQSYELYMSLNEKQKKMLENQMKMAKELSKLKSYLVLQFMKQNEYWQNLLSKRCFLASFFF